MILEIIRNVLAFNLVLSDCLQAYSIFLPVEKSLFHQGLYIMNVLFLHTGHMHNLIPENGRTVVRSYIQIVRLDGLLLWVTILYNHGPTLCELRYNKMRYIVKLSSMCVL